MTPGVDVTIVIPARNAASTIADQIGALRRQYRDRIEIVLVDNGSSDDTVSVARRAAGDMPLRVVHESRPGVNVARNAGVRAARAETILMCDADDVVGENWIENLSRVVRTEGWAFGTNDLRPLNDERDVEIRRYLELRHETGYLAAFGSNCGFSRSDWLRVGTFDERLSGWGDETEFLLRLTRSGVEGVHVPDAVVAYRVRPGVRSLVRDRFREGASHRRILLLGLGDGLVGPLSRANLIARLLAHIGLLCVSWPQRRRRCLRLGTTAYYLGRLIGSRADRRRPASDR